MRGSIRIAVNGALGHMGREVIRAVMAAGDLELVGAVDIREYRGDIGILCGAGEAGLEVSGDLEHLLRAAAPQVVIDFTTPTAVMANVQKVLQYGARPVVGTTGFTEADLQEVEGWVREAGVGCFIAPNFAIGAVLMAVLAARAASFMEEAEIVELHHPGKIDAPSGTALWAADMLADRLAETGGETPRERFKPLEKLPGTRGGSHRGIHIHSVRMPGLIAHHEIILGGPGQTLTLRHDSLTRQSFIPGILLAVRKVMEEDTLIYGLEKILSI
jgi:4-hydroxy-tetrahydrodipicolinate reductase